jgi:hypothetical protein
MKLSARLPYPFTKWNVIIFFIFFEMIESYLMPIWCETSYFRVSQTVTSTSAGATIYSGPMELLVDVPIEVGCFQISSVPTSTTATDLTPASCLVTCNSASKRFAGQKIDNIHCEKSRRFSRRVNGRVANISSKPAYSKWHWQPNRLGQPAYLVWVDD